MSYLINLGKLKVTKFFSCVLLQKFLFVVIVSLSFYILFYNVF